MVRGGSGWEARAQRCDAEQRRREAGAREKLELLRSGDGMRLAAPRRKWRKPRAKEAGPTRRLGGLARRGERADGGDDEYCVISIA
jgi:hypothetical protein